MRISLCFRRVGGLYRLVWLNESGGGLYYGFLGAQQESHESYHADGIRHTKLGSDYHPSGKSAPISEWRGVLQLGHVSMPFTDNWLSAATAYIGDEKTETVVIIDESHFREGRTCALDIWLLDRASEPELYEILAKHLSNDSTFTMIADVVSSLDSYPDHKVAITLRSGPPRL